MDTTGEGGDTRQALECLKPYLRKLRAYIEATGRKFELEDEMEKIDFYLGVIDDPQSVSIHGVTQLRNFISEIHSMDYRNPIPPGWKTTALEGININIGDSPADKLRAKNKKFDEWKKSQKDEWGEGTSPMFTESEKQRKAVENESWNEERKNAPTPEPWGDTNVSSSSTTTRTGEQPKSDELPDWLEASNEGNQLFERRRQPGLKSETHASSSYSSYAQEQATLEDSRRRASQSAQKTRNGSDDHWFFGSQQGQERSHQRQSVPAQAQPFAAQSHSVPVTPIYVQMHPGAASSIYEPGRGVMYVPISMPVPSSVPYGGPPVYTAGPPTSYNHNLPPRNSQPAPDGEPPVYTAGPPTSYNHNLPPRNSQPAPDGRPLIYTAGPPTSYNHNLPPRNSQPAPVHHRDYSKAHGSNPRYSPYPSTPAATYTHDDSPFSSAPPPPRYNPRPHIMKHGKKSFQDRSKDNNLRNTNSSNYISGRRPPPKPPLSVAMRKRMETDMGGFYKLGQREKHYEEKIDESQSEGENADRVTDTEPEVITESMEKLLRQQLKKKAADELLKKGPQEVLSFLKLVFEPKDLKTKLNDNKQQPSKRPKVQQRTELSHKKVTRTAIRASSSDMSDFRSSSSSDVGSTVNERRLPRSPASKKSPQKPHTNKPGRSVQQGRTRTEEDILLEKRNKKPVYRGVGSCVSDSRSDARSMRSLRSSSSSDDVGSTSSKSTGGHGRQLRSGVDQKNKKNERGATEKKAANPAKSAKQVAVKRTKSKYTGPPRSDKDDEKEQESSSPVVNERNKFQDQERSSEAVYSMLNRTIKTFKPRFTAEGNQRIGAQDLVTNVGLGKIKLEADYLSPVVEKQECMTASNVEELEYDPFFEAAYPEVSLKVEEGVSIQVETERDHSDDSLEGDKVEEEQTVVLVEQHNQNRVEEVVSCQVETERDHSDDAFEGDKVEEEQTVVPVSVEQHNQNRVEEVVSYQVETDRDHSGVALEGEKVEEVQTGGVPEQDSTTVVETTENQDASGAEQNQNMEEDMEESLVIGNVVSLTADIGNETHLNKNQTPGIDEGMDDEAHKQSKVVACVDEEQEVEHVPTVKQQPREEAETEFEEEFNVYFETLE